ncbi:MAG: hypothetical protein KDE20_20700 [Caldilineaceae bacterium]|nr:hypothetical protein [Caldilineaceae bacterium]
MSDVVWHDISEFEPEVGGLYLVRSDVRKPFDAASETAWYCAVTASSATSVYGDEVNFCKHDNGEWAISSTMYGDVLTHYAVIDEPEASNGAD